MSIRLLSKVWTLQVTGTEREVLNVMCDHADDFGNNARPSIAYIAWKVGCDERTVIRQIKNLRQKGALLLVKGASFHSPNIYRVNLAVYEEKPKFEPKGDAYHEARGDILSPDKAETRGDKMPSRGDKLVSPKPSFEPYNHQHKSDSENLDVAFGKAFSELCDVLTLSPFAIEKFKDLWHDFPDPRRHERALDRLKQKGDPNFNYYETVFRNFNPDYVPPRSSARSFPANAPQNKPRENAQWTPTEIEAHKRALAARRAAQPNEVTQ